MNNDSHKPEKELSRRTLLQSVAIAGAAAVPVLLAGSRSASAENGAGRRRLSDQPKGRVEMRQLQIVRAAERLQIGRRRDLAQRLVQDLGQG